jgi:hypothetical protein
LPDDGSGLIFNSYVRREMLRKPVYYLMFLGAALSTLVSCIDEESPEVGVWKSNMHSHQHGSLQHSHPYSGVHTHEGMENGEQYLPFSPGPADASDETTIDVAALADRGGSARGQSARVRGKLVSLNLKGEHCVVELASLSKTNVKAVVEATRSFCTTLRDKVDRTLVVRGTFPADGNGTVIEAEQIEIETAEHKIHPHKHTH